MSARTGYVHHIIDNGLDFKQSMLLFARGIGYLVGMRDEPLSSPLPETIPVDDAYNRERLAEAEALIAKIEGMSVEERQAYGAQLKRDRIALCEREYAKEEAEENKINDLAEQVKMWVVPKELESLRNFALQQLDSSRGLCYWEGELTHVLEISPEQFVDQLLKHARRDVVYHNEQMEKDRERIAQSNTWLKLLREHLP
jgi:hypothetical protein